MCSAFASVWWQRVCKMPDYNVPTFWEVFRIKFPCKNFRIRSLHFSSARLLCVCFLNALRCSWYVSYLRLNLKMFPLRVICTSSSVRSYWQPVFAVHEFCCTYEPVMLFRARVHHYDEFPAQNWWTICVVLYFYIQCLQLCLLNMLLLGFNNFLWT
jgi:hypothetical protein